MDLFLAIVAGIIQAFPAKQKPDFSPVA